MSDKRQKNQLVLAFTEEGRSEAPKASQEGTESRTAKCETERPASHEQLMEEVCERENCWQAYKRIKANKGSPGIDGMKVGELSGYLKQHWPTMAEYGRASRSGENFCGSFGQAEPSFTSAGKIPAFTPPFRLAASTGFTSFCAISV
jgi:hypothetical protein